MRKQRLPGVHCSGAHRIEPSEPSPVYGGGQGGGAPIATRGFAQTIGLIIFLSLSATTSAQERSLQAVIDDYVAEAMRSNLTLQGENFAVEQSRAALDAARAHYLPELSLSARYTVNQGGRDIEFPVGDLLNPVYSTLNDMLVAQGQSPRFPMLDNQSIPLMRPHEQDTHLSVRQPLYAPAVAAGVRAQQALFDASRQQRIGVARQLKRDVTVAYLNWLQASEAVQIVDSTHTLLNENLRINRSLFDNGKITEDQPLRAQAELLAIEQQQRQAQDAVKQAQSYVNFLLNRSLDMPLESVAAPQATNAPAYELAQLRSQATNQRPELKQLEQGVVAANEQIKLARAEALPSLSLGVDAGIQGDKYGVGSDYNYASASLLLNWKFYAGGGLKAEVDGAKAQARRLQVQRDALSQQINLQVQQALDRYRTSVDSLTTALARTDAARAAFRIAGRKRDEGAINQVEFLDARSTLTNAELNLNVTRYAALIEAAQLDYVTAEGVVSVP
ncbi:MAG: TolC family protein [Steroidobacteraceae bacterium]